MASAHDLIEWTLEQVAEKHGDPTPEVYERLFAQQPEIRDRFVMDKQGLARGNMLANVFEVLLDVTGPRRYGANMVLAEIINHEGGLNVPRAVFFTFFTVVMETMRDLLGAEWTPEVQAGWDEALATLDNVVREAGVLA